MDNQITIIKIIKKTIKIGIVVARMLNPIRVIQALNDSESESKAFYNKKPIKIATLIASRVLSIEKFRFLVFLF